jgi:DNA-binding transcriptional regulator LsrR (DeoR family)
MVFSNTFRIYIKPTMPRAQKAIDKRLLSKVSSMYYDQDYNQQEIANRLHLSRPKVSRLLKKARQQGIVQITVVSPDHDFLHLEKSLEEKYELKEAVLIDAEDTDSSDIIKRKLGSSAANYLHRTISNGDTIGVSWGTTLQAMVDAMQPKKVDDVHIVQTLGGVGPPEAKAHATDISRRLSKVLDAQLTLLPAPGIVGSVQAREVLLAERRVKGALNLFSQMNTLYVGIGAMKTNPVLHKDGAEISAELYDEVINSKAVGDIALQFYDINGNAIDSELRNLLIGITPEEIKQVDTVVGIAGGAEKLNAIRGALKSNLINVLITDNLTAAQLIED